MSLTSHTQYPLFFTTKMADERKHKHHEHLGELGAAAAGGYALVISLLPVILVVYTYTFFYM